MLPPIVRHVICPTHEWLLGRRTMAYARELDKTQWLAPCDLRELQRGKLQALLRHAAAHTPFYRRRFEAAGVDLADPDTINTLAHLPLLDKAEIRASIDEMTWHDAPGGVFEYSTGGSTGEPLTFHLDRRRQGYDQAARIRSHRWFGVDLGERELYLWGSPLERRRSDRVRRFRDALFNHRLLDAFNMSPRRMDAYLEEFDRFRPACLFGYPSGIALMVDHARSRGKNLDVRRLRVVFVTGEVCYPHQRESIESFFGVPVADCYGSREGGFIAHQCPEGSMHITAENLIVEMIGKDGSAVAVGEIGEIVITHLDAYAMPLIRYRTGDLGRLMPGRCCCGRGLPLMDVAQGRSTDFLRFPDGTVKHALAIIYPLRELRGVRQFRVTQGADFGVTVEVVADDRQERITREAVARCVRPVLGDQVELRVNWTDRIDCVESGKHRYVVSHVRNPAPEEARTNV